MPQPILFSLIDKVIYDYNLIQDGDKILIGASGGKDSTALIEYFANRVKRPNCNFEYKALAIQSDFSPSFPENIKNLFDKWNVPFEIVDVDIMARLKPGRKMNCYWCSTQRRSELLKYAMENNKVEAFNLGTGTGYSVFDLINTFIRVNEVDIPYSIEARRPGDIDACYANPDKAYKLLGWKTTLELDTMCKDGYKAAVNANK